MHPIYAIFIISLSLLYCFGRCDVYLSVDEMKYVIQLEAKLIQLLDNYVNLENNKLVTLNKYLEHLQGENSKGALDMDGYLGNPINAYLLIKRLTVNLEQIEALLKLDNSEIVEEQMYTYKQDHKFPNDQDLSGTIGALIRLQYTYKLDTASVAKGVLAGVKYNSELGASDCYIIGKSCYENNDFLYAYEWLKEAKRRSNTEDYDEVERSFILQYLALSAYKIGRLKIALKVTNHLLTLFPNDVNMLSNRTFYRTEIGRMNSFKKKYAFHREDESTVYHEVCREHITPPNKFVSSLKCRYVDNNNHFLRIAPFKLEELYLEPKIVVFHDVIYDKEIETLKQLSHTRFEVAQIFGGGIHTRRTGKVAWIHDREHQTVNSLSRRINLMTGMKTDTAEDLQVCNYGVGGHFNLHYDYAVRLNETSVGRRGFGNRIATVLFYMNEVSQGGATIFPKLKVRIKPKKGSAAFWYNLYANGTGIKDTIHGACPVIAGSKWVSNKWLYEFGQEFLRPCELDPFHPA